MSERRQAVSSLLISIGGLALVFTSGWLSEALLPQNSRLLKPLEYGLEHLGVVIVVAMLVRGTLEAASQRDFLNVVNDHVKLQITSTITKVEQEAIKPLQQSVGTLIERLTYRITSLFDESLQQMLRDSVLNPTFIRPKYTLHLKLDPVKNKDGSNSDFLNVFVGLAYEVRNVTTVAAKYPIEAWLDDVIQSTTISQSARSHFTRIAFGEENPPSIPFDLVALEKGGRIVRNNGTITTHVKDVEIKPNASLFVNVEGVQLMRMQDHFVWNLVTLTRSMDIIVELLNGLTFENFDVFPREMHHIGHEAFQKSSKPNGNSLTMSIDQVLLPYQGLEIRWSPRIASAT